MLNEHNCENCIHYPICIRKEAMQNMIAELKLTIISRIMMDQNV